MRTQINENSFVDMLGMKPLTLLDEDENTTNAKGYHSNSQT